MSELKKAREALVKAQNSLAGSRDTCSKWELEYWDAYQAGIEEITAWNRRATQPASAPADPWHKAALDECMLVDGCYHPDDPARTIRELIDWHVKAPAAVGAPADISAKDHPVRECIDGAILNGRVGEAGPPTTDHWLYEYWCIGQQLSKLGETSVWDNVTPADDTPAVPCESKDVGAPQGQAEPVEKEYELHQDDMMVAGAYGDTAWQQIQHYAAMYSQDGPVEIYEVTRRKISKPTQPSAAATDERDGA